MFRAATEAVVFAVKRRLWKRDVVDRVIVVVKLVHIWLYWIVDGMTYIEHFRSTYLYANVHNNDIV